MKKAIAVTQLVIILLAIGAGVGLLFFSKKGVEKAGCRAEVETCRTSFQVFKRIKEEIAIEPRVDCIAVSPPNCEEKELKTEDKTQTMHIIAENLRWCWYKTLGLKNTMGDAFGYHLYLLGIITADDDVDFCLVCSEFTPNVDISVEEWNAFLDNRKIPNTQQTYEDYLDPIAPKVWEKSYRDIGFKKGQKYFVVSVSAEESEPADQAGKEVYIYIAPEIYCGDADPQVHYQLR